MDSNLNRVCVRAAACHHNVGVASQVVGVRDLTVQACCRSEKLGRQSRADVGEYERACGQCCHNLQSDRQYISSANLPCTLIEHTYKRIPRQPSTSDSNEEPTNIS